jgi:hypothetical protein
MYLNLDKFEMFESAADKKSTYKKNASTWSIFVSTLRESIDKVEVLERRLLSDDTPALNDAIKLFEDVVKAAKPGNESFTYYLRPILEALLKTNMKTKTILVYAKCPKITQVGFAHDDIYDESSSGFFLDPILYAFLKGLSFVFKQQYRARTICSSSLARTVNTAQSS